MGELIEWVIGRRRFADFEKFLANFGSLAEVRSTSRVTVHVF